MRPVLLLCAALLAAACARGGKETEQERKKPREMSTADVMNEAARATYQPPVDGKLTDRQIRMFLEVERRSRKLPPSTEPGATHDLRATLELGYNPKEMAWIQERMMDAWIALRGQELDRKIAASRARMLRDLETQARETTDPARRADLEKQITNIRSVPPVATQATPALEHNAELLRQHEAEVARAFTEERPQEKRNAG